MYAFRKPFAAATFTNDVWLGVEFKTILVTAQVSGYTLSKFIGIKVVSEMSSKYRAVMILGLIAVAEIALLLFAITPKPWNFAWLFVNGLPLGMVFGLVLGFLEGRKVTEALSAGLCASFIVSSGFVKSVGSSLLEDYNFSEVWMPVVTGLIFVVPLLFFVWMLSKIPPPTADDELLRTERTSMSHEERKAFFGRHAIGLITMFTIYVMLTVVRSIRDDFGVEIWRDMGVKGKPEVFAKSEFWVGVGVTLISGCMFLFKNNRAAFLSAIGLLGVGFMIVIATVFGQRADLLSPMSYMILLGFGLYIPYVTFHTTIFERMFATFREKGTIGYLMYVADAVGYLGYVGVMIFKDWFVNKKQVNFLKLLNNMSIWVAILSFALTIGLLLYYFRVTKRIESSGQTDYEPTSS